MKMNTDKSINISWEDIKLFLDEDKNKDFLENIDPKTFQLILDENSKPQVVDSVLKMLKKREQEKATQEYAEEIVDMMRKVALQYVDQKTYKSYLMGANKITDDELSKLDIEIFKEEDSDVRKLIIPASSIEKYKALIRKKLNTGFWNDFVGEDQVYFIFKMSDGEIKEFEYNEADRLDIANLCTHLNKDPIEKTRKLLDYLAENSFYAEEVEKFMRFKLSN